MTSACGSGLPGRAEVLQANCAAPGSPLLWVHRNSRKWKNTPKRTPLPVQIVGSLFHPSWKDRELHESHISAEAPQKCKIVLKV